MKNIEIYTDGACSGNPGPGGWAAVLIYESAEKTICGAQASTTNNRMELTAVIKALERLNQPCNVLLHTDSSYIVDAFNKGWISSWLSKGWINSQKQPVKNTDLWKRILELKAIHTITWVHVKGHADDKYNNICDSMARSCSQSLVKGE